MLLKQAKTMKFEVPRDTLVDPYYCPQTKLREEGSVFRPVCHSVQRGISACP